MGKKVSNKKARRQLPGVRISRVAKPGRWVVASFIMALCCKQSAYGGMVRDDIPYHLYRDFAENKGLFQPGATNITIHDNDGAVVGTLNVAPMPDFSSVDRLGSTTLIGPQHIVSVAHKRRYQSVTFGGSGNNPGYRRPVYSLVNRNDHPDYNDQEKLATYDFHVPRLNKLVVETAPATMSDAHADNAYMNAERFPVFYRLGSGDQYVLPRDGTKYLEDDEYEYLTGGTVRRPTHFIGNRKFYSHNADIYGAGVPLGIDVENRDSGSPLFAWDTERETWVLVGTLHGVVNGGDTSGSSVWVRLIPEFITQMLDQASGSQVNLAQGAGPLRWGIDAESGNARISGDSPSIWNTPLQQADNADAGKNIRFAGASGTLILDASIDQGAGSLTFDSDFVVRPQAAQTWQGAGLSIAAGAVVDWQVNGVAGDSLHKIGPGTLRVTGSGMNEGSLNLGDGTVLLARGAGTDGRKQAFDSVTLFSGRPTLKLADTGQIDANKIFFGYRGGRLDLNGNDLTLNHFRHVDNGARIVNGNLEQAATLTVDHKHSNRRGNIIFQGVLGETDSQRSKGELNLHYASDLSTGFLALTGGADMNRLRIENGRVLLSGAPVRHADDAYRNDWHRSTFRFNTIEIDEGKSLRIGPYAEVQASLNARRGSRITLGLGASNETWNTIKRYWMADDTGVTRSAVLLPDAVPDAPETVLTGTLSLERKAQLAIGKARYAGSIDAHRTSTVSLAGNAHWQLSADSTLGGLNMAEGARITFSGDNAKALVLRVAGDFSGAGQVMFNQRLGFGLNDQLVILGEAAGRLTLDVEDQDTAVAGDGGIFTLLSLKHAGQDSPGSTSRSRATRRRSAAMPTASSVMGRTTT